MDYFDSKSQPKPILGIFFTEHITPILFETPKLFKYCEIPIILY